MLPGAKFLGCMGPALIYQLDDNVMGLFIHYTVPKYYWRYYDKNTFYGPFDDKETISRHVNGCLMAAGRHSETIPDNVVKVDFKLKKRIS